uniref:Cytochrome b n=1 Tax=Ptilonyssus chloris TaxID=2652178 RepID=A0A5Q0RZ74_9ACAR
MYKLPTPSNINNLWNFGSMISIFMLMQLISGLLLSFHYSNNIYHTFFMMSHIMRNVNYGWFLHNIHANGASMLFMMMYIHISRGIYYKSYLYNKNVWYSGMLLYIMMMITSFLGYILPWGQMSYWAATVITNLISSIPYIGMTITNWLWGGYNINNATLNRFFSMHFMLPFIMMMMIIIHIMMLHEKGSSNPLGNNPNMDKINFHPYFTWKDLLMLMFILYMMMYITLIEPNLTMDPNNWIEANMMITPIHIQPEWYFLFAYAILRSIPNKLGGIIMMLMAIMLVMMLPTYNYNMYKYNMYYISEKLMFWLFISSFLMLTYLGSCPIEMPFIKMNIIFSMMYFMFFLLKMIKI